MRGWVTHKNGEHTATCSEPGCIWTLTSSKDGEVAHELTEHEHIFGTPEETLDRVTEQIRQQSMRDHPFEGEGIHCKHWSGAADIVSEVGTLTFSSQCGYPRDLHPEESE